MMQGTGPARWREVDGRERQTGLSTHDCTFAFPIGLDRRVWFGLPNGADPGRSPIPF